MSRMIRFHKFGAADVLRCEEQAEPSPAVGEVQIRVEAIGVSWYDVLWRQNLAPSQARLPAGIGHEMAGVVTAVGDGVDDIAVGDRVASFPATSANDHPVYGDVIVLPRTAITRYPAVLTPIEASVHYTPLLIAYFAYVDLARAKAGQTALVTDASHCAGPAFVQLGKALGLKVFAATKAPEQREYLLGLGADKVIVTEEQDLLMQIGKYTDGRGVDMVLDGLGGPQMSLLGDAPHVAAWCSMACKVATKRLSRPVRRSRRTSSSMCTVSATSPVNRSWASARTRLPCNVPCAISTSLPPTSC